MTPRHRRLEQYKGTWIEAWAGRFRLEGPEPLLWLALHAGLGAKNSQGFGYVDVEQRRPNGHRTQQLGRIECGNGCRDSSPNVGMTGSEPAYLRDRPGATAVP